VAVLRDVRARSRGHGRSSGARSSAWEPGTFGGENFHDVLKAQMLHMRHPLQIIRRSAWDEMAAAEQGSGRQDKPTRAWNIHAALYYKAGGVPWRLARHGIDLTACFIGVSSIAATPVAPWTQQSGTSSTNAATA
jgi:hypothetical protein